MDRIMNKVCYLTRIHNEESLIFYNLIYYYNLGIRHFYITFNNSNEITREKVDKFFEQKKDAKLYPFEDKNTRYEQIEIFDMMSDAAYNNGHFWQVPADADEILFLKKYTLKQLIRKHDMNSYGYVSFRWIDYHPIKGDIISENYFTKWNHREIKPRGPSKIIYKWSLGCKHGHGNHLLIAKRKKLAEIPLEDGFYAHFPSRSKEQLKYKMIRIGKAFLEKYGEESEKPQITQYKQYLSEGDSYFDNLWSSICKKREFSNYIFDPLPENLFK